MRRVDTSAAAAQVRFGAVSASAKKRAMDHWYGATRASIDSSTIVQGRRLVAQPQQQLALWRQRRRARVWSRLVETLSVASSGRLWLAAEGRRMRAT